MSQKSLSGHQSAKMLNDEWLTTPEIIEALGDFAIDPCSPINRPWPTALLICLVAYGRRNAETLELSDLGKTLILKAPEITSKQE